MSEKQWIDNTDSYICPECNFEVRKPLADYNFICPKCGFYDRKDFTTSHDEKDIYEGCLSLMEGLVSEFHEYLDYLGIDTSEQDEEEKFCITYNPTEIVERLFLWKTSHSGGTSQRLKCKELGINDRKTIRFDFSDDEAVDE